MIIGINIVAVPVDDIDQALHFYCDVLGMEKRSRAQEAEACLLQVICHGR